MNTLFLRFASVAGLLSVIAGALLSHQLKQNMPDHGLEIYETAVRYMFYHVFALLAVALLGERSANVYLNRAGLFFIAGTILFSGSLFLISFLITRHISVPTVVGVMTPIGGLCFILGWFFLIKAVWRRGIV